MLTFVEPAPSNKLIDLAQLLWPLYSGWLLGVDISIQRKDVKALRGLCKQRVILCANHCDHPDPSVMFGISRAIKRNFAFMTARELFLDYPNRVGRLMQRFGCFSVMRAAPDLESYKATVKLLIEGHTPVVIFPEGEISHQNHFLLPLEGGPEQIALDVVSKIEKNGQVDDVFIQPMAFLYRYRGNLHSQILELMDRLEKHLGLPDSHGLSLSVRLKRAFAVHLKDVAKIEGVNLDESCQFDQLIKTVLAAAINNIAEEQQFDLTKYATPVDQIHALKNYLSTQRFSKHLPVDLLSLDARNEYRMLKRITNFIAIGEHSFKPSLTQEEAIELLNVLEYDLFRSLSIRRRHLAYVGLAKPISVRSFLSQWQKSKRSAVDNLKTELRRRIETEISRLERLHPSVTVFR